MRRQKIIAFLVAFCFSIATFFPTTIAFAQSRPPQRRTTISRPVRRPVVHKPEGRMRYSMANQQKRYQSRHNRHHYNRVIYPNRHYQRYRYDGRYYYYGGHRYRPGVYSGWYNHHHYSMHTRDWIEMIGFATFFMALSNINHSERTIVKDCDGNVFYLD